MDARAMDTGGSGFPIGGVLLLGAGLVGMAMLSRPGTAGVAPGSQEARTPTELERRSSSKTLGSGVGTPEELERRAGHGTSREHNTIWVAAVVSVDGRPTPEVVNRASLIAEEATEAGARRTFCKAAGHQVWCFVKFDLDTMEVDNLHRRAQNFKSMLDGEEGLDYFKFSVVDKRLVRREVPQAVAPEMGEAEA